MCKSDLLNVSTSRLARNGVGQTNKPPFRNGMRPVVLQVSPVVTIALMPRLKTRRRADI
jgi:hypothetical protein